MREDDVLKWVAAKVRNLDVNVLFVRLVRGGWWGSTVGCVCDVNLEDTAGRRRCGGGEVSMSVCVVGRCESASDRVLKEVLQNAPTAERGRGAPRVSVK